MKKSNYILLSMIIFLASCTEKIDIELDESYTRLVVYGNITTDTTIHYVELTTTTSYYYNQPPPPVSSAIVEIDDNAGNTIRLDEEEPGRYATPDDYYVEAGKTYTLNIMLAEAIDDEKHYTASSTVTPSYPIDSIALTFWPDFGEAGFYEIGVYYWDPPTREYYMFDIYKNGVHLTDTITNRNVMDDLFFNGNYTNGASVGFLNQAKEREKVYPGDTILFKSGFISESYANFIWELQEEVSFSTPLFSGPPANVNGNISHGAVGFFAAYSVAYSSMVFQE